jgi:hypothetical protein
MPNRIIIDKKLPLQFYIDGLEESDQYLNKHMNDWRFSDTILPWEERVDFNLPFNLADLISLQLQSNVGPVNLELYTCHGDLVDTIGFGTLQQNENDPTMYLREVDVALAGYDPGVYYFKIKFGISPVILSLISENIILSERNENTLLLEYSHEPFLGDMIFADGYEPQLRVEATLKYESPEAQNVLYEDDDNNAELLDSVPYDIWKLYIGGSLGIPDYLARKINRILGCSTLKIDGKYYTRLEGGKLERTSEKDYPMSGWAIELREVNNRSSAIYENEEGQDGFVAVMVNSDGKGFGSSNAGDETVVIDVT